MKNETNQSLGEMEMHVAVKLAYHQLARRDKSTADFTLRTFDMIMEGVVLSSDAAGKDSGKVLSGLCYLFSALDKVTDKIAERKDKIHLN